VNRKVGHRGPNGKQFTTALTAYADLALGRGHRGLVAVVALLPEFPSARPTAARSSPSREDEIAAASSGVDVSRYKMPLRGRRVHGRERRPLYAPFIGFVKPDISSFNRSVDYLIYVGSAGMEASPARSSRPSCGRICRSSFRPQRVPTSFYPVILILVMLSGRRASLGTRAFSFTALAARPRSSSRNGRARDPGEGR
jgi:branched-chain amino acid transport system permease protein